MTAPPPTPSVAPTRDPGPPAGLPPRASASPAPEALATRQADEPGSGEPAVASSPLVAEATPTPTSALRRVYVVQRGDRLKDIAARYGVALADLIRANNLRDPDSLRVGQELLIPGR